MTLEEEKRVKEKYEEMRIKREEIEKAKEKLKKLQEEKDFFETNWAVRKYFEVLKNIESVKEIASEKVENTTYDGNGRCVNVLGAPVMHDDNGIYVYTGKVCEAVEKIISLYDVGEKKI